VIAGGVFGDGVALERGQRVGEQGRAARPQVPVDAGETVSAASASFAPT
jgi:hypothetical protein